MWRSQQADRQPYAFVLAVLCGYAWAIFRWIDTGRLRHAIAAALLAVLTAYGHILLSLGLVVPAFYAVWNRPKSPQPLIMSALAAVLSVPLVFQLRDYMAMSTTHIVAGTPTLSDFWPALASDQFLATIGAGVLLAFVALPRIHLHWGISRAATLFLFAWIAFPPATLFVLGRAGLIEVFVGRYMLSAAIPQAILFGGFVRAVAPARARSLVVETLVVVSVGAFFFSAKSFHGEGWKDAIAAIRMEMGTSNLPLLMSSPFVEADTAENVNDPKLKDVLYAPILIYRTPGRLIRLPFPYDKKYLDQVVDSDLKKEKAFVLLTADLPVPHWLDHRLADRGVESTVVGEYRGWRVYRYRMTR